VVSVVLVRLGLVRMLLVSVLISRNATQVTTHATPTLRVPILKAVSNAHVIPDGVETAIHVMILMNVSSMFLIIVQIPPLAPTSTVDSAANANLGSLQMPLPHLSLVMTLMSVLMVITLVIRSMAFVPTTMEALNVPAKTVGQPSEVSPVPFALTLMNVFCPT